METTERIEAELSDLPEEDQPPHEGSLETEIDRRVATYRENPSILIDAPSALSDLRKLTGQC